MREPRWVVYDRQDQEGRFLKGFRTFRKAHRYAEELRSKKVNAVIMPSEGWK